MVHATGGVFRTEYRYLTSYKGLGFYTKARAPLDLPRGTELVQANIKMDTNRVSSCRQVVEPLRDAWRQAAAALAGSPS